MVSWWSAIHIRVLHIKSSSKQHQLLSLLLRLLLPSDLFLKLRNLVTTCHSDEGALLFFVFIIQRCRHSSRRLKAWFGHIGLDVPEIEIKRMIFTMPPLSVSQTVSVACCSILLFIRKNQNHLLLGVIRNDLHLVFRTQIIALSKVCVPSFPLELKRHSTMKEMCTTKTQ